MYLTKIENMLDKCTDKENLVIIVGSKEYIKTMNDIIEKYSKNTFDGKFITIINCFEATQFNTTIKEILQEHKYILNTSGEKNISDVFEMYVSWRKIYNDIKYNNDYESNRKLYL